MEEIFRVSTNTAMPRMPTSPALGISTDVRLFQSQNRSAYGQGAPRGHLFDVYFCISCLSVGANAADELPLPMENRSKIDSNALVDIAYSSSVS